MCSGHRLEDLGRNREGSLACRHGGQPVTLLLLTAGSVLTMGLFMQCTQSCNSRGSQKKKSQSGNSQHAGLWCTATHDWLSAHSGVCGRICAQWGVWQEASPACPLHRAEVRNALLGPRFSGKNVALCRCPQRGTMRAQDTVHRDNPGSMILTMGNLEDSLGGPRCWDVLGNP